MPIFSYSARRFRPSDFGRKVFESVKNFSGAPRLAHRLGTRNVDSTCQPFLKMFLSTPKNDWGTRKVGSKKFLAPDFLEGGDLTPNVLYRRVPRIKIYNHWQTDVNRARDKKVLYLFNGGDRPNTYSTFSLSSESWWFCWILLHTVQHEHHKTQCLEESKPNAFTTIYWFSKRVNYRNDCKSWW